MRKDFLVVGAGFTGAVIARCLAAANYKVTIIDERDHIAGNCHTERDSESRIMVHRYGPHIFNTNRVDVWKYVNSFGKFQMFTNRVKAIAKDEVYSLPINLHTINQFYRKTFSPAEAMEFIKSVGDKSIRNPTNFEEQALMLLGRDLYECFFYGYTKKQWGCEPTELPASILLRLPIRFNYDDNYYNAKYQGMPICGYSDIVSNILDHDNIKIKLSLPFDNRMSDDYSHTFYSGSIDRYFSFAEGWLGYRTVTFEENRATGDYQGNAVINYPDIEIPYTRIHEHKHFSPWETYTDTVFFMEYSKETTQADTPYYPKRLEKDKRVFEVYHNLALRKSNISFVGRLGTYRYLNMDQAIGEALDFSQSTLLALNNSTPIPKFTGRFI